MKVKATQGNKTLRASRSKTSQKKERPFSLEEEPLTEGAAAQEAPKFDIGARPETPVFLSATPAYEDLGELPESYGENRIFMIARDPQWLFCYWDVDWNRCSQSMADVGFQLRLLREDGSVAEQSRVNPHAPNWYLPVPEPDTSYFVELGYEEPAQRRWVCLCQSDMAYVPPAGLRPAQEEEEFATVPLHLTFQHLLETVREAMRGGESLVRALSRLQKEGQIAFGQDGAQEWSADQRAVLEALLGREVAAFVSLGSGTVEKVLRKELSEFSGPERAPGRSLGPQSALSSPSSAVGASWSGQPFGKPEDRGFFLNVNAEVIFYGATDPDASVTVAGEPIHLNPDGSFRYHFLFPDRDLEIPIVARSCDGVEERTATLSFRRDTARTGEVGDTAQPAFLPPPPTAMGKA